ncbi:hypothetical protein [Seonamhaeicola marinus]|uniref:Replication protein n=1 Tax=Seonamhaeicola marinus TaxID=1912246 RepID=A0A5D0HU85_9FLAO|nr:hypothetical protein [Seonamhaeicola marinus]TYA74953.1 hypothetical protein FUA24_16775 [Seonamhaeicola marinus]
MGTIVKTKREKVKGKDIKGQNRELEKAENFQMSLFQTFLPDSGKYSNTIELYDSIPKYMASRSVNKMRTVDEKTKNGYLPSLKRKFHYKTPQTNKVQEYIATMKPARIESKDGTEIDYYLTEREEFVEEALRKIAADNQGIYLDDRAGVRFTLRQLRAELKSRGHDIHHDSLIEALNICNEVNMEVKTSDGEAIVKSNVFPVLLISSRKDWLDNPTDAYCYVQFHPLVTQSVDRITHRQFDYDTHMKLKGLLARWLHKKLSHYYTNADWTNSYNIKATTIIRDSGLVSTEGRFRDSLSAIETALKELRKKNSIRDYDAKIMYDPERTNRIIDAKYDLHPSTDFISEMKAANKRKAIITERAAKSGYFK